jgi:NitT/TauT family transport system permease protein
MVERGVLRGLRDGGGLLSLLSVVALLSLWEGAARAGWIHEAFFPRPTVVGAQFAALVREGVLGEHLSVTLGRLFWSFLVATLPGVALGLVLGVWRTAREVVDPLVAFVYPIPSVLFLPLAAIVLGRGEAARVATAAVTSFLLVVINTTAGVRQLDRGLLEAAMHYGAVGWRLFTKVLLPGSLPWIFTGLRLALGLTLIVVIAVEMVGAETGLGAWLWLSWQTLRVRDMYAGLLVIAALGLTVTYGLEAVRQRLVPWQRGLEREL